MFSTKISLLLNHVTTRNIVSPSLDEVKRKILLSSCTTWQCCSLWNSDQYSRQANYNRKLSTTVLPKPRIELHQNKVTEKRSTIRWIETNSIPSQTDEYLVVYRGNLSAVVKATKLISLSSSAIGFAAQPYLISIAASLHPALVFMFGTVFISFTYITPFLLHFLTKRYVTEIRFNPTTKMFECTTLSFFLTRRKITFQASDVEVPDFPGLFTTFLANNIPLFVDWRQFSDLEVYKHLVGYDKPIDFEMKNFKSNEEKK